MAYAVCILITLALLVGFLVLSEYEMRRGVRFFPSFRTRLDQNVAHIEFVLTHVDLAAFIRGEVRHAAHRIGHDIAHLSLQAVRGTERLLTRLVMHLRSRRAVDTTPRGNVREFVRTLSDFKGRLKETRPEMPEIQ